MGLLPLPFLKFIPKIFGRDQKAINLADKADEHIEAWRDDILKLNRFFRPDEAESRFLNELDFYLSADFKDYDDDATKRKKIRTAVQRHKDRGTWEDDAKLRIDNITGLSPGARIFRSIDQDDWILVGDGLTPSAYYWAALGADGIDTGLGISLIGEGNEIEIAGNIYIDCHEGVTTPVLTADQIARIVGEFSDLEQFAYYRLFFGYLDGSGVYQVYDSIG